LHTPNTLLAQAPAAAQALDLHSHLIPDGEPGHLEFPGHLPVPQTPELVVAVQAFGDVYTSRDVQQLQG